MRIICTVSLLAAHTLLGSCTASSPEPDCENCDPVDLGMPCETLRSSDGFGPLVESSNFDCRALYCVFDSDDEPRRLNSRELCLEEGSAPPEVCNDGTFYSMEEFVERTYCTCRCGVDCPCDSPGFECRSVEPVRSMFCMRVLE